MGQSNVRVNKDGMVATVAIDRPEALNALNLATIDELTGRLEDLNCDPETRAIIITGAGGKAFIAGADVTQFEHASPKEAEALAMRTRAMHDTLQACRTPIVAAINGYCLGAGLEVALACDIRIGASTAKFGLPEIKLGILPGGGGTVRLTQLVGSSVARAMAFTGDLMSAEQALQHGILYSQHAPEALAEAAASLASKLAGYSPYALGQLKSVFKVAESADVESALTAEVKAFALCFSTEDQKEGARAFLTKRPPHFTGR